MGGVVINYEWWTDEWKKQHGNESGMFSGKLSEDQNFFFKSLFGVIVN